MVEMRSHDRKTGNPGKLADIEPVIPPSVKQKRRKPIFSSEYKVCPWGRVKKIVSFF